MRGIPEKNLCRLNAAPAVAQSSRQVAAHGRRDHRHHDEIKSGADFEGCCRNTGIGPRRYHGKSEPGSKRQQDQCQRARRNSAGHNGRPGNPRQRWFNNIIYCPSGVHRLFHNSSQHLEFDDGKNVGTWRKFLQRIRRRDSAAPSLPLASRETRVAAIPRRTPSRSRSV